MWEPGLGAHPAWGPCMATGVSPWDPTLVLVSQARSWTDPKATPVQVASLTGGSSKGRGVVSQTTQVPESRLGGASSGG